MLWLPGRLSVFIPAASRRSVSHCLVAGWRSCSWLAGHVRVDDTKSIAWDPSDSVRSVILAVEEALRIVCRLNEEWNVPGQKWRHLPTARHSGSAADSWTSVARTFRPRGGDDCKGFLTFVV